MARTSGPAATALLVGAILAVFGLAIVAVARDHAGWLEGVSFVTGAVCVWLVVRESPWNFPLGLVNAATFSVVFFQSRLFGDSGLQALYFILNAYGWSQWLRGGAGDTPLRVGRSSRRELAIVALLVVCVTLVLWQTLRHLGGSASFLDAATTSTSLGAQWLMVKKRLESWHVWIVVDIVYVPLYVSRELYLTAILYAIFLGMAVMGLRQWRLSWLAHHPAERAA